MLPVGLCYNGGGGGGAPVGEGGLRGEGGEGH